MCGSMCESLFLAMFLVFFLWIVLFLFQFCFCFAIFYYFLLILDVIGFLMIESMYKDMDLNDWKFGSSGRTWEDNKKNILCGNKHIFNFFK